MGDCRFRYGSGYRPDARLTDASRNILGCRDRSTRVRNFPIIEVYGGRKTFRTFHAEQSRPPPLYQLRVRYRAYGLLNGDHVPDSSDVTISPSLHRWRLERCLESERNAPEAVSQIGGIAHGLRRYSATDNAFLFGSRNVSERHIV